MTKTAKKTDGPMDSLDLRKFRALIAKHDGQWHLIAADRKGLRDCGVDGKPVSRQAFTMRVERRYPDLMRYASDLRDAAGISGPRFEKNDTPAQRLARRLKERARILDALKANASTKAAAEAIGISQRTFSRRIADLKIGAETLAKIRESHRKTKSATA